MVCKFFLDKIVNLGSNHIWRYLLVFTLVEISFATISYSFSFFLLVCKLRKYNLKTINYILKLFKYTDIDYIWKYLVSLYIEGFVLTVCCSFTYLFYLLLFYICWSVSPMTWVSKFRNFLRHVHKLRQDLYLRALSIVFMEFSFLTFWYFFLAFFIWSVLKGHFQPFYWSVNWVFELCNIFSRCPEV